MFRTRLISGIALVIIAFLTIHTGGLLLWTVLGLLSLIGMHELFLATGVYGDGAQVPTADSPGEMKEAGSGSGSAEEKREQDGKTSVWKRYILGGCGFLGAVGYYSLVLTGKMEFALPLLTGMLLILMSVYVFLFPQYRSEQVMAVFFSLFYLPVLFSCIYLTRQLDHGRYTVWLIFLSSWGCDTCAYCVGMLCGKHKMAPVLSPKKSIEGAVGGVAGAVLLGVIYALCLRGVTGENRALEYGLICGAGALWSMIGDLAASAIKRNHQIKDYGKLIPGHGGVLDRFDSVLFTAPMIFALAVLLIR